MRRFLLALTLAPLIRILSLSLPLSRFPQLMWYPFVAVPLLLAAWVIIRQLKLTRHDLGLRLGNPPLQLAICCFGFALGLVEYYILKPGPQLVAPGGRAYALAALNLLLATGFTEELIFRGILQTTGKAIMGRWALLYTALLFGMLHIGYLSVLDVVFVACVGLIFASLADWSGSILGVTIAHGITNSMLFLVMPHLPEDIDLRTVTWAPWALAGIVVATLGAIAFVVGTCHRQMHQQQPAPSRRRSLQRPAGTTYVELAQRTGLSARRLCEIEQGLSAPLPEELQRIAQGLGQATNPGGPPALEEAARRR